LLAATLSLNNETHADSYRAITDSLLQTGVQQPRVFISDHEEVFKMSACALLPGVSQLKCVWHINNNIQTKAQQIWSDADGAMEEGK
jgi:hypothetical protein